MKPSQAELDRRLAAAAELRAAGASWDQVAARVRRSASACRRWPNRYPDLWGRLYADALRRLKAEAGAEAVHALRGLVRSADEKVRLAAARAALAAADAAAPTAPPDPFTSYLDGCSPDELQPFAEADEPGGPAGPAA